MIRREDKTNFIVCESRDRIAKSLTRKRQLEKLNYFKQLHKVEFAFSYAEGEDNLFWFSKNPGYSLAQSVKAKFGSEGKYLWVDRIYETNEFIFVCIDNGTVSYEAVVDETGVANYALSPIFEMGNLPKIYYSNEIPGFLAKYIQSIPEFNDTNCIKYEFVDHSILDSLPTNKLYLFKKISSLEGQLNETKTSGNIPVYFMGAAVILGGIFILSGDKEAPIQNIIDPYESYRAELSRKSADSSFYETYKALVKIEYRNQWKINVCEMNEDSPLVCELNPGLTARSNDLQHLENVLGSGTKTRLFNQAAHIIVPINSNRDIPAVQIVKLSEIRNIVFDRLSELTNPGSVNILEVAPNDTWSSQVFEISKSKSNLSDLISFANSLNGLPVNLVSLKLKRDDLSYTFQISVKAIGGNDL